MSNLSITFIYILHAWTYISIHITYKYIQIHTHTYTYIHIQRFAYIHIHIRRYAYIYIYSQAREFSLFPSVGASQAREFSLFPAVTASQAMEFSLFHPLEALQAAEFQIARQRRLDSLPNPVFFECVSMFLQWFPSKHGTLHFCRHKTGRKHHVRLHILNQNSFIPERPFFANKQNIFANSMFIFHGAHVSQQQWKFAHHLPNYARESRITSSRNPRPIFFGKMYWHTPFNMHFDFRPLFRITFAELSRKYPYSQTPAISRGCTEGKAKTRGLGSRKASLLETWLLLLAFSGVLLLPDPGQQCVAALYI